MRSILVLLSGGQDSATCLALAKQHYSDVYTLSFNYGQRHLKEIDCASHLSSLAGVRLHKIIQVSSLEQIGNSSLLRPGDVSAQHARNETLPSTFVPGRNIQFLTLAAAFAYGMNIYHIMTGVSQVDYSGYPDCRKQTINYLESTLRAGMEYDFMIHTPLIRKSKKDIVLLMQSLGKLDWLKHTHTCYEGERPPCGTCPACKLRAKGFQEAGILDPLLT